jgi:hypothetical protein
MTQGIMRRDMLLLQRSPLVINLIFGDTQIITTQVMDIFMVEVGIMVDGVVMVAAGLAMEADDRPMPFLVDVSHINQITIYEC